MRVLSRLSYLLPSRSRIGYMGWVGHQNLGDEAMYEAIKTVFPSSRLQPYLETPKIQRLEAFQRLPVFRGVLLGGGTLINTASVLDTLRKAKERYQRIAMFGTGVQSPDFWTAEEPRYQMARREWAEFLDQHVSPITVRGPLSSASLRDAGCEAPIEVIGDPALLLADNPVQAKPGSRRIMLNFGTSEGYIWGRDEEAVVDFAVELADALTDRGWSLTLLSMWTKDDPFVAEIATRIRATPEVVHGYRSLDETLRAMRRCDVLIGEKLHAVILAHCTHTPSVMLEYRPKCRDYMQSMGLDRYVMRTDELDVDRALAMVDELADGVEEMQAALARRIEELVASQRRTAETVEGLLLG